MQVKGILLAGGHGTRLYPLTKIISKQLLPIYNKPVIYYSLTTLMLAGIREILLISTPEDLPLFRKLMGDGSQWGISLSYAVQDEPRGIAEAFLIGDEFIGDDTVMLMLGDNFIYGRYDFLREALEKHIDGATIFASQVSDPSAYGVVEFNRDFRVLSLEEKPEHPRSNWAVPGLYVYGPGVVEAARGLTPSARGEIEITDLNRLYLEQGRLRALPMGRGVAWLDTGTPRDLLRASEFVHVIEDRQGLNIGCPEEVAMRMGLVDREGLDRAIQRLPSSSYRDYVVGIATDDSEEGEP